MAQRGQSISAPSTEESNDGRAHSCCCGPAAEPLRASIEVADIFRSAGPAYRTAHAGHLSLHQFKVMSAIEHCRTATLGGHVEACEDCGHRRIACNGCRLANGARLRRNPSRRNGRKVPDEDHASVERRGSPSP
jgi:hypothetical protein